MKIFNYCFLILLIIILFSCSDEDKSSFRVKRLDTEEVEIKNLNSNYRIGDRYKDNSSVYWIIIEKLENSSNVIYSDKIKYLKLDSLLVKGDTVVMNNIKDTIRITKGKDTLKNKYILK